MILKVKQLSYGVSRPQSWWDGHPDAEAEYQKIKESISKEGIKNPLVIRSDRKIGWVVEVGNQRLRAANELGIDKVECVLEGGHNGLQSMQVSA